MNRVEYTTSTTFNAELEAHKISQEKFWLLPEKDRSLILSRYASCVVQRVSNRRFNPHVHQAIVSRKKKDFFEWVTTLRCYEKIKK